MRALLLTAESAGLNTEAGLHDFSLLGEQLSAATFSMAPALQAHCASVPVTFLSSACAAAVFAIDLYATHLLYACRLELAANTLCAVAI